MCRVNWYFKRNKLTWVRNVVYHFCDDEKGFFRVYVHGVYSVSRAWQRYIINHETEEFFFIVVHRHTSLVSHYANLKENCATKMDSILSDKEGKEEERWPAYGKYAANCSFFIYSLE